MLPTDVSPFTALSAKLTNFSDQFPADFAEQPGNKVYDKTYGRLQAALAVFQADPLNSSKEKSLNHASDNYQTAIEMMLIKTEGLIEQARSRDVDLSPIINKYGAIFQKLF